MRSFPLLFALLIFSGCNEPSEGDEGEFDGTSSTDAAAGSESTGPELDPEELPEGTDLELGLNGSQYLSYAECPEQDLAHFRLDITAPPEMDIVSARLLAFEIADVVSREGSYAPQEFFGELKPVSAGERGTFTFNIPIEGGPVLCPEWDDSPPDEAAVVLLLDVHGTQVEVEGEVALFCSYPAPHTCD